jgi:hypothetical protein
MQEELTIVPLLGFFDGTGGTGQKLVRSHDVTSDILKCISLAVSPEKFEAAFR